MEADAKINTSDIDLKEYYVDDPKAPAIVLEELQKYDEYLTIKWDKLEDCWALLRLAPWCKTEGQYFLCHIQEYNIPTQKVLQALLATDLQRIGIDAYADRLDAHDAEYLEKWEKGFQEEFDNLTAEHARNILDHLKHDIENNKGTVFRPSKPPWRLWSDESGKIIEPMKGTGKKIIQAKSMRDVGKAFQQ